MSKSNLEIWNRVHKTDPVFTKEFKGAGGFEGTSINSTYVFERATELWGPCGVGWGYEIIEERFDTGGAVDD